MAPSIVCVLPVADLAVRTSSRRAIHDGVDERQRAFRKDLGLACRFAKYPLKAEAPLPQRTVRLHLNRHYVVGGLDDARRLFMELAL